jgi:hypothetical protein
MSYSTFGGMEMKHHLIYEGFISIEDIKQRKVLFLIVDEENTYKPILEDILRKSHDLNISWKIIIRDAEDGRLITLIKNDAFERLVEGGWKP